MIKGIKEVLFEANDIWKGSFMDIFYDIEKQEVFSKISPMSAISKHFYNIQSQISLNVVYVTTLFSHYKYNEEILEDMTTKAVDKFLNPKAFENLKIGR